MTQIIINYNKKSKDQYEVYVSSTDSVHKYDKFHFAYTHIVVTILSSDKKVNVIQKGNLEKKHKKWLEEIVKELNVGKS